MPLPRATSLNLDAQTSQFYVDVRAGLSRKHRSIPPRWFYDKRGSELFDEITELEEYYLTRSECEILETYSADIAAAVGTGRVVVEYGAGSMSKIAKLVPKLGPSAYVPIDLSSEHLLAACASLANRFPDLSIYPVVDDLRAKLQISPSIGQAKRLGFFPGSTIGNMSEGEAVDFLRSVAQTLGRGANLLIGMDRRKSPQRLMQAYDDARGVTARFNLNLLSRINVELGGNIPVQHFKHVARWNEGRSRIEMHLMAARHVVFEVGCESFEMEEGETIHTENSYKYSQEEARLLLRAGGWEPRLEWTDRDQRFSVFLADQLT